MPAVGALNVGLTLSTSHRNTNASAHHSCLHGRDSRLRQHLKLRAALHFGPGLARVLPSLGLVRGLFSPIAFAWLLTKFDSNGAGRAHTAYGGIHIVASLAWPWAIEGKMRDRWDVIGGAFCILDAVVILYDPRTHDAVGETSELCQRRCGGAPRRSDRPRRGRVPTADYFRRVSLRGT